MFFPLKDVNPTSRFPIVTVGLVGLNALVFAYELTLGSAVQAFVAAWGAIPYEITRFVDLVGPDEHMVHVEGPPVPAITLVSSMFIHGGFFHILGNMLYLWIFGNNVEDVLGPVKFLVFYLLCGLAAGLTHVALNPNSTLPAVGASGAVSGILGAYLIAFPHARVLALVFVFVFIRLVVVPAGFLLVFWFIVQALSGFSSILSGMSGGVAWFAHIGGFIAGIVLFVVMGGARRGRSRGGDWG